MTATDIDLVMTEGLGRRYAFMGVLETAYLNAHGNRSICIYLFLLTYKESICMVI
jgi:L-gulonate 3-dehydrogenase